MNNIAITYINTSDSTIDKLDKFIQEWNNTEDFIIAKSSGSTGKPKELKLKKEYLKASALMTGTFFNFEQHQTILLSLSIDTIGGKMIVIRALIYKMHLIVVEPTKNPLIEINLHIDFVSMVPYQLNSILIDTPSKLKLVKTILLGGAPVSYKLIEKIKSYKTAFFESFGMTETMSHIALKNLKDETNYFNTLNEIQVSANSDNQLIIRAEKLGLSELITTDEVNIISPTSFEWIGRTDFAINSGGLKFHPEILEKKLEQHIAFPFFIHKETDLQLGEKIVLCIENMLDDNQRNELYRIFNNVLDKYEIPKIIYCVPTFSYTNSKKINRISTFNSIFHE
jgi:O-succinylbenzoic acid--CoA ligase